MGSAAHRLEAAAFISSLHQRDFLLVHSQASFSLGLGLIWSQIGNIASGPVNPQCQTVSGRGVLALENRTVQGQMVA